ncbi:hypothetical protein F511_20303 [Dorcoceras hygrometricum]|uniref:Uncharacterized protein n=1 Tax=Dorcoceras hygrometricum TaxID=472368 RepID=A0A2Z7D5Q3_9LAMI|nr:hypothetical protein F511_20303 [Dorcoceras hygrometricum]
MYMSMIICLSSCAPHGFEFFCMASIHGLLVGSGLVVKWFMLVLGVACRDVNVGQLSCSVFQRLAIGPDLLTCAECSRIVFSIPDFTVALWLDRKHEAAVCACISSGAGHIAGRGASPAGGAPGARTDSPRKTDRSKADQSTSGGGRRREAAAAAAAWEERERERGGRALGCDIVVLVINEKPVEVKLVPAEAATSHRFDL